MVQKKSTLFMLMLSVLFLNTFQTDVFAEEEPSGKRYQITDFKELPSENDYIYLLDEVMPKPEELEKIMPDSLTAITEENENISIPVEWYCDEEEYYDDTVYTIVFEPKFDTTVYNVEEECELPSFYVDVKAREEYKPSTLNLTGNGNEDTCYNFLRNSVGLNNASSCGVLGNLYIECSFNPLAYNSKENAWGICQWRGDRLSKLQSRYPNSWKTLDSQLNFLVDEFNGADYSGPKTLSYLRGRADDSNGAQEAAQYFAQYFERCASSTYASRKSWAVKFYNDRISVPTPAPSPDGDVEYYPACSSSQTSLVDALKSIGVDSSYSNRKQIAELNGISDYTGTSAQNNQLLSLLKQGKLIKSKKTTPTPEPPVEVRGSEMTSGYDRVLPDGDYIIASAANPQYFLDIEGGAWPAANETNVSLYNWSGDLDTFDTWTIRYSDGFYRISQNGADVSLDVYGADTLQGKNVQVHANNDSSAQKWAISGNRRNGYRIQAKCSGYSLDIADGNISNGTNVRQYSGNDTDAQAWVFIPYKPSQDLPEGRYVLLTDLDRTMELDVEGDTGDIPSGTNVQIWKDTAPSQYNSFDIIKLDNGYYKIIHVASGKALDLYGAGTALTTNISLADVNGGTAQQWAIRSAGGGAFVLWARCSGMVMDVENSQTANGTNVLQYAYHGERSQRWYFVKAEYPVTYDSAGGQETPAGQTKYYKSDLKLSSAVPQKDGYVFKGWNDSKELNGTLYAPGSTYTKDENLKLYAVWEKQSYKITYHLDGGTNADGNPESYYAEDPYVRLSDPSKEGYIFEGWYLSQDGDEAVTEKTKLQGDVDLYARWRKDGTPALSVRWDKETLTASVSNMDCATGYGFVYGKGEDITLETLGRHRIAFTSVTADQTFSFDTSGIEEGNSFRGYVTYKADGKEAVVYADPVTYPEKYTVYFDADGGECTEASREVSWGDAVGILPESKKDYFEFTGWHTEDGQTVSDEQVFSEETVRLTASWKEKPVSEDFVKEDQLPSGAQIVEEKYTYTKRNYTESSSSEMAGWTRYDRKRTGWGGQQGPVYSDPSNGERNVWSEDYVTSSNYKTVYHYFRYSTGYTASGGSDKPTSKYGTTLYTYDFDEPLTDLGTEGNYSRGYKYYYSGSRYCTVWKSDPFTTQEWVSDNHGTRWYYQDPVYTYYFYKDESKTSSTYPTESDISNVVKWVRYREK